MFWSPKYVSTGLRPTYCLSRTAFSLSIGTSFGTRRLKNNRRARHRYLTHRSPSILNRRALIAEVPFRKHLRMTIAHNKGGPCVELERFFAKRSGCDFSLRRYAPLV